MSEGTVLTGSPEELDEDELELLLDEGKAPDELEELELLVLELEEGMAPVELEELELLLEAEVLEELELLEEPPLPAPAVNKPPTARNESNLAPSSRR